MKLFIPALLTVTSIAIIQEYAPSTNNVCFEDQGAVYVQDCMSLFYKECDTLKLEPKGTCNFMAKSNSQINWHSSEVEVYFWTYAEVPSGMTYDEWLSGTMETKAEATMNNNDNSSPAEQPSMFKSKLNKEVKRLAQSQIAGLQDVCNPECFNYVTAAFKTAMDDMAKQISTAAAAAAAASASAGNGALTAKQIYDITLGAATDAGDVAVKNNIELFANGGLAVNSTVVDEDGDYDCVQMSSRPNFYTNETPMPLSSGICGYKFQIINQNEEFGFSIDILKDNATALAFGSSLLGVALAFF